MVDFTLPREYIDDMVVRMAHHSTAIEGNTLTQGETKSILLDNMIPRKMDLREFYEVSNYRDYLVFLMESYQEVITIDIIRDTQRLLLAHIRDDNGQFKVVPNMVIGADFEPTKPYQVQEALKNWCDTLQYRLEISQNDEERCVPLWSNICNLNVFILLLMVMAVQEELLLYTLAYNRN